MRGSRSQRPSRLRSAHQSSKAPGQRGIDRAGGLNHDQHSRSHRVMDGQRADCSSVEQVLNASRVGLIEGLTGPRDGKTSTAVRDLLATR